MYFAVAPFDMHETVVPVKTQFFKKTNLEYHDSVI